jgi:hypothetical protein
VAKPWLYLDHYKNSMKLEQFNSTKFIVRVVFIGLMSLTFTTYLKAQITEDVKLSKVNLYADAGLHIAAQASINLEGQIYSGKKTTWYGRAGVGTAGVIFGSSGPGGLAAITMLTGKGNNHFEMNGGAFIGKGTYYRDVFVFPLLDLGYRYQKPAGGFIFRAKAGFLGIGIGLGYAFKTKS